jgi:hypothetical protein
MNRVAVAIAVGAIAAVSFAIGRATVPTTTARSVARAKPLVFEHEQPASVPPDDALRACEAKLALAEAVFRAQEHEKVGDPVPFPDGLAPQYRPEGFEDAVRDTMRACPRPARRLARIDCTEFPCMAFFMHDPGADEEDVPPCERWTDLFGPMGGMATDQFMTKDGLVGFSMQSVAPIDVEPSVDPNNQLRWTKRLEEGKAQLMGEVDGRELTELEQLDQQIELMRQWGAGEEIIPALEARRAKLAAEENGAQ